MTCIRNVHQIVYYHIYIPLQLLKKEVSNSGTPFVLHKLEKCLQYYYFDNFWPIYHDYLVTLQLILHQTEVSVESAVKQLTKLCYSFCGKSNFRSKRKCKLLFLLYLITKNPAVVKAPFILHSVLYIIFVNSEVNSCIYVIL